MSEHSDEMRAFVRNLLDRANTDDPQFAGAYETHRSTEQTGAPAGNVVPREGHAPKVEPDEVARFAARLFDPTAD
jgi:hypothetical protein